jgi:hypothetical protein
MAISTFAFLQYLSKDVVGDALDEDVIYKLYEHSNPIFSMALIDMFNTKRFIDIL